ncbi:MAG: S41 family peptidase [Fimbriimonadaceae bacterium]
MNKLSSPLIRFAILASLLLVAAVGFAQPRDKDPISADEKQQTLNMVESMLNQMAFVPGTDFKTWPEMVKKHSADIEKTKTVGEFTGVINNVMTSFGFSHIVLFSPEAGQARATQSRAGIGIRIEIEPGGLRVVNVFPGSPASEVGFQPGDLIFEADGKAVKSTAELAGEVGQTSTVKYRRGTEDKSVSVTRRQYSTILPETVEWNGDVAILKVPSFDAGYSIDNIDKLMAEIAPRAKGVVLDLRGNGGGRVTNLQHLASYFLIPMEQPMGTFVGKFEVSRYAKEFGESVDPIAIAAKTQLKVTASRNKPGIRLTVPVSCLIDAGSGSASEMMASALREQLGSKLYGRKSAGAVLASRIMRLGDDLGFMLQFPVTDYVTIKGVRIEGHPIVPDREFEIAKFGEPDLALTTAIKELAVAKFFALAG